MEQASSLFYWQFYPEAGHCFLCLVALIDRSFSLRNKDLKRVYGLLWGCLAYLLFTD